ncbi:GNAT family N-acetyltransferase [Paenibacillus agricola]|uniref:GNAT family N-acetyltransferase n=1 Tax=Paenibacillus agricola TaxID=2716264 RepID=A0ABX0JKM2_9BACL|nr:GNAT family N-acetyltransferase [Paenibacillus agricola]NHN34616.1 GNAT family N-acetyltransferase [Paenibacillus agricola]
MVNIRDFSQSDIEALAELMGELGYPTSIESMLKRMEAIESSSMNSTFVAEIDDKVVGMIGLLMNNNYEYDSMVMQIVSLVTRADHRGTGVGSALIKHAEEWATTHGASAMSLTSGIKPERVAAHEFYKNKGYYISGYRFSKKL